MGVGGIGMSGLAEILLNLGYKVSGSDLTPSEITDRLKHKGLDFKTGHCAEHIGDAAIVVVSAAISDDNPEIQAAIEHGIPILHRSDLLADLIRLKPHAVVVGGSHGKTTTTSMVSAILDHADIGATSIIGGILHRSGTNAQWGTGEYIVAEADEHDGSFLRLHPTIAVVTNIDAEHLEYYGTIDKIKCAFIDFCNNVPFYGRSILCADDENTVEILSEIEGICITYGLNGAASLVGSNQSLVGSDGLPTTHLSEIRTRFDLTCTDARLTEPGLLGTIELKTLGDDNVRNALAASAVALSLGLSFQVIRQGLAEFEGVQRRLQIRGEFNGVVVVEDYAHHPTEIASTLKALRLAKPKRILCIFQPHLYTRTKYFSDDFARVLSLADRAIVTDIYPSREEPMAGVTSSLIVDAARRNGAEHVELVQDMTKAAGVLIPSVCPGDAILILGAGDIHKIIEPLLNELSSP